MPGYLSLPLALSGRTALSWLVVKARLVTIFRAEIMPAKAAGAVTCAQRADLRVMSGSRRRLTLERQAMFFKAAFGFFSQTCLRLPGKEFFHEICRGENQCILLEQWLVVTQVSRE